MNRSIVIACACASLLASAHSYNLLCNGSLESGNNETAFAWIRSSAMLRTNGVAHEGRHAMACYGGREEWANVFQRYPGDLSGKTVRVTCWVMSPSSSSAMARHPGWFQHCSALLKIQEPHNNDPIQQVHGLADEHAGGVRDRWICLTNEIASFPGGTTNFVIACLGVLSNGIVYFDNIRMEVLPGPGAQAAQRLGAPDAPDALRGRAAWAEHLPHADTAAQRDRMALDAFVRRTGMPRREEIEGVAYELLRLDEQGLPDYALTHNRISAIATATDKVRGTAPYHVTGSGWHVGVWDFGIVRSNHQELIGRINVMDNNAFHYHATHVAGTICASGLDGDAIGMAPQAAIDAYQWNNDVAKMVNHGAPAPSQPFRLYLSNHSYGQVGGWAWGGSQWRWWHDISATQAPAFGQYNATAEAWDTAAYYAPFYLIVKSAGNDRTDTGPEPGAAFQYLSNGVWATAARYDPALHARGDGIYKHGYDTIAAYGVAKNILTVGAVSNAVTAGIRDISKADMTPFSSWGPADDGRVKPDVVGNGINVYSTISDVGPGGYGYWSYDGTSVAAPGVCGAALLLMQYYASLHPGSNLLASAVKGLIIHTADDLGPAGPDYRFGWGLINTVRAAETIRRHAAGQAVDIRQHVITTSDVAHTFTYYHAGIAPLHATLCWTDPPGRATTNHDDRAAQLVNDLDVRIYAADGATNDPFVLDYMQPEQPAMTGDNTRDNVEQVLLPTASAGTYTVRVSYKGGLYNGQQEYSLIVSEAIPEPVLHLLLCAGTAVICVRKRSNQGCTGRQEFCTRRRTL